MKSALMLAALLALSPTLSFAQDAAAEPEQAAAADAAPAPADESAATPAAEPAAAPAAAPAGAAVVGQPEPGMAQVVFFRASKFAGAAIKVSVFEGDKPLGVLKSGRYFVVSVAPGTHTYSVDGKGKDPLNLEVEAGETYYVNGSISMGFMKGNANLSPSDAAAYQAELKDMRRIDQ